MSLSPNILEVVNSESNGNMPHMIPGFDNATQLANDLSRFGFLTPISLPREGLQRCQRLHSMARPRNCTELF